MVLLRLWLVLGLVILYNGAVVCEDSAAATASIHLGVWDVSTLVPGRGAVPSSYVLHVEVGEWTLRERHASRVSRLLDVAAASLGITYAAVPPEETALCRASSSPLAWEMTATRSDDGFAVDCGQGDEWLTTAVLRRFARDGFAHVRLATPQPLFVRVGGGCVETPWSLHDALFTAVSDDTFVVTATLHSGIGSAFSSCVAHFELTRRPTAAAKEASSSPTSTYAPLALLFVVMVMRLLPRYFLTRSGQVDKSSYRGKNPGNLTKERRLELLRKQRHIIEQMKAEDQANAPKQKAS